MPERVSVDANTTLVEEIHAKVYDTARSRLLTLLEVALGNNSGLGASPLGRLLDYLLQDIEDAIWAVAKKRGIDVSEEAVTKAREEREKREQEEKGRSIEMRLWKLRGELEALEERKKHIDFEKLREETGEFIKTLNPRAFRVVQEALDKLNG